MRPKNKPKRPKDTLLEDLEQAGVPAPLIKRVADRVRGAEPQRIEAIRAHHAALKARETYEVIDTHGRRTEVVGFDVLAERVLANKAYLRSLLAGGRTAAVRMKGSDLTTHRVLVRRLGAAEKGRV